MSILVLQFPNHVISHDFTFLVFQEIHPFFSIHIFRLFIRFYFRMQGEVVL